MSVCVIVPNTVQCGSDTMTHVVTMHAVLFLWFRIGTVNVCAYACACACACLRVCVCVCACVYVRMYLFAFQCFCTGVARLQVCILVYGA